MARMALLKARRRTQIVRPTMSLRTTLCCCQVHPSPSLQCLRSLVASTFRLPNDSQALPDGACAQIQPKLMLRL
jgi:hypothetical protein